MGRKRKPARFSRGLPIHKRNPSKKAIVPGSTDTAALQAFRIPLILRTILKNLSVRDLLKCSLVSKGWNYEARCTLRDFHVCYAGMKKNANPCLALKELDTDLSGMPVIPYSGLRITVQGSMTHGSACVGLKSLNRYYDFIVNRLPLKYLELSIDSSAGGYQNCPAVQLIKKILPKKSGSLEEFSILNIPRFAQLYLAGDISSGKLLLPRLKLLKVSDSMDFRYLPRNLLPDLISASPNLEELRVEACPEDLRFLPLDKLKIVKTLLFIPMSPSDEELYRNFALARPQLRDLRVRPPCLNYAEQKKFWDILRVIIESSSNSLESLSLASLPALMLKKFAVQPLKKVTSLVLQVDVSESATPVRSLLKRMNFSKLFPSLTSISIYEDSVYENEVEDYVNEEEWEFEGDATAAIGKMYISFDCFHGSYVQFLSEMFPNIVDLRAVMSDSAFAPLYAVWDSWPNLQTIRIEEVECHDIPNVDAVFCGITPEEAAILQEEDEEFLRKVNIVPIRPSITCFRQLKKFHLSFPEDPFYFEDVPHGLLFLSKVTGLVAFKRMPDLEVVLELCDGSVLKHLEPFATVCERAF